ncbi:MAG: hypothetical protein CVU14_04185 [Bacteroidetes bacterium HGW-Bacteroidetes-9]|nr:MAG: hypothetical protein CVU14_04185 [Bacteroidetes bacterium HGW-Bacteroidetes-9]
MSNLYSGKLGNILIFNRMHLFQMYKTADNQINKNILAELVLNILKNDIQNCLFVRKDNKPAANK